MLQGNTSFSAIGYHSFVTSTIGQCGVNDYLVSFMSEKRALVGIIHRRLVLFCILTTLGHLSPIYPTLSTLDKETLSINSVMCGVHAFILNPRGTSNNYYIPNIGQCVLNRFFFLYGV